MPCAGLANERSENTMNKTLPDYLDQTSIAGMGRRPFRQPPTRSDVLWSVIGAIGGALMVVAVCFL